MAYLDRQNKAIIAGTGTSTSLVASTSYPMNAGEIAYATDTKQLYVGTDPATGGSFKRVITEDASGNYVLGGATNNITISGSGNLTANGTATWFDDIRIEPTVRSTGVKAPTYTQWTPSGGSASGLYFYLFDNAISASEKEVNFKLQMPHGKKLGSVIHLHVHWMPTSTGSAGDKVRWGLEYTKANPNAVFSAPGSFIYATDPANPPSTTPTQDTHYITEFADIDMTGDALSTILPCRLFRNSSHADDTFAGDVMLLYIDAHVEFERMGSNDEYA